ncbi:hypothetical protein CcrMagneto_gp022 [Caulobacter virus Magneto]|uniref:hypothetical protein n=1 Tax=Caulobacter virus Magneto TaxID=1211642 RepID=UPI00028B331F|nr:hypothetical protein CcrMagneto_gp022 [Caulobacter virus Magneto]AFU87192.1 hypothetical protein CcrMagneto_gp022 [Caulobacter virus Magneto]
MTELSLGERYAREALAVALFGQRRTPSSIGGAPASLWHEIAPQQRGSWREQADRLVAEQAGDATAVTKDQTRILEPWEAALKALADGKDPDDYYGGDDHRADRPISTYYRTTVTYDYALTDETLLKAWASAERQGLSLPAFPEDAFSGAAIDETKFRTLTAWEAAVMAVTQYDKAERFDAYRFKVPFEFRFTAQTLAEFNDLLTAADEQALPNRAPADNKRYPA